MIGHSNDLDVDDSTRAARSVRWLRLSIALAVVASVWLLVLPAMARRPAVKSRLQFLEERAIDPSAMFYTELDAMDPILRKLEERP